MKTPIKYSKRSLQQPTHLIRAIANHLNPLGGYICNPLVLTDRAQRQRATRFLARLKRSLLVLVLSGGAIYGTQVYASNITATLEPAEISLGEAAQLTVSIQGQDEDTPQIPAVNGLSFQHVAQSSQIQIINGVMSANISHTFAVVPTRDGAFTIPEIKIGSGREAAASRPLVLKVVKRGGAAAGLPSGARRSVLASIGNGGDENVTVPDKNDFGFLRVISPKTEFYVGEMVPVELRACFRSGVELQVDSLPQLNSDAFAMNKLSGDPARSEQVIDGVPYTVFSWSTAVTAVKAGDYELSVQLPATVTVRQRAGRPPSGGNDPFDDFFDDAFFSNFFGAATQKQVALDSQPMMTKILPLPTENRPAHFAGTVGKFDFSAEAAPAQTALGDPITLKLKVSGSGNFDRVAPPVMAAAAGWKSYQPGTKFSAADETGCSGEKTFEQVLMPARSGPLEIPALAFSYFDPEKKQYVTNHSQPITINVTPGGTAAASPPPLMPGQNGAAANSSPTPAVPELKAENSGVGISGKSFWQGRLDPWFVGGGLVAAVVFAVWRFFRRRPRSVCDPTSVRQLEARQAVAAQLQTMETAAVRGATTDFFKAARRALQIQLGMLWNLPPQTITQVEINSRMNDQADRIRPVFEVADEVTYTGRALTPEELRRWRDYVNVTLREMEAS